MSQRCGACGGVYHPATGHAWTPTLAICGPCARDFLAWWKHMTHRRWGGVRFYDHASFPPEVLP